MNTPRSKYQVHAEVRARGVVSPDFDEALAGHPLERRLNRIERVAATYLGQIDKRLSNGRQMVFETADAALLGACEMQQRCSVLPQVAGKRLALRIGIHQGLLRQRSLDGADNAREIASQLAVADDAILVSDSVVAALSPELRQLTHIFAERPAGIGAHQVDWRSEIPSAIYGGESVWPAGKALHPIGPYLLLYYEQNTFELTQDKPVATIGREPLSNLVLEGDKVSRNHCRIERRADCVVLTDLSTNGTSVVPDEGAEILVKKGSVVLKGKGMLFFGRPCNGERRGGVRFEGY